MLFFFFHAKIGHEVEFKPREREQTGDWEEPSQNAMGVRVPIILCFNLMPRRSGRMRFFVFLLCLKYCLN